MKINNQRDPYKFTFVDLCLMIALAAIFAGLAVLAIDYALPAMGYR